ncbi:MAG: hypothetical protein ACHQ1H_03460 [Nitrososphaerales archaeon]
MSTSLGPQTNGKGTPLQVYFSSCLNYGKTFSFAKILDATSEQRIDYSGNCCPWNQPSTLRGVQITNPMTQEAAIMELHGIQS